MLNNSEYIRCLKCNKILKSAKARMRGYGDTCWKKHKLEYQAKQPNLLKQITDKDNLDAS